jgi:hypothetical protein
MHRNSNLKSPYISTTKQLGKLTVGQSDEVLNGTACTTLCCHDSVCLNIQSILCEWFQMVKYVGSKCLTFVCIRLVINGFPSEIK